jgi:hypothetical protein
LENKKGWRIFTSSLTLKHTTMKIELENGYLHATICEDEITLDNIKVFQPRKGTGRQLVEMLKTQAINLGLPIGLYAEPQDDTISEEDLKSFYYSCNFELDPEDTDGKLFIWR